MAGVSDPFGESLWLPVAKSITPSCRPPPAAVPKLLMAVVTVKLFTGSTPIVKNDKLPPVLLNVNTVVVVRFAFALSEALASARPTAEAAAVFLSSFISSLLLG
jgi:hypothetical protein